MARTTAGSIRPILKSGYRMTYYTQERLLSLIISDVITWMNDEFTPYTPTYPEILPYLNTTLPPYWLEEKCIMELGLLLNHLGKTRVPDFITNYNSMLSIQVYTGMSNYYNGI